MSFLKLSALTLVVKTFVCGEKEVIVSGAGKRKNLDGDEVFVRESKSLFYLYPQLGNTEDRFREFHEFSINCGQPMGVVLTTKCEVCRLCKRVLLVEPNSHVVVP